MSELSGPYLKSREKNTSLVVLLHGYGADGDDLIGLASEWQSDLPHTAFVAPHAPYGCEGVPYGRAWFNLEDFNPLSLMDPSYFQTVVKRAEPALEILDQFIKKTLLQHGLTRKDLALVGFSQGSMMALGTALLHPEGCAAVVGYSGGFVPWEDHQIQAKSPVFLAHGADDQVIFPEAMTMTEQALSQQGVPVQTILYPHLAHSISAAGVIEGGLFLKKYLNLLNS